MKLIRIFDSLSFLTRQRYDGDSAIYYLNSDSSIWCWITFPHKIFQIGTNDKYYNKCCVSWQKDIGASKVGSICSPWRSIPIDFSEAFEHFSEEEKEEAIYYFDVLSGREFE